MRQRVFWGRFFIRLGRFVQSLAIMVMRPDDLVEFSREFYARKESVKGWSRKDLVDGGLSPEETALLGKITAKKKQLLLLGVGGGREAVSLARMGFEVTGLDFVTEMVKMAKENAASRGLRIRGQVQEISKLLVPEGYYDIVWLSAAMYSCVPTRKRRVEMLRRIWKALRTGGYFICQFQWETKDTFSPKAEFARKVFALLSRGNLWYEKGDMLWGNAEFMHAFSSEDEIKSEFKEGDFEIVHIDTPERNMWGGAVLKKS